MPINYSLTLNESERQTVGDILDAWLEPFEEATNAVMTDPLIAEPEELLEAMDGMHQQFAVVSTLREKIRRLPYGRTASTV